MHSDMLICSGIFAVTMHFTYDVDTTQKIKPILILDYNANKSDHGFNESDA